MNRYEKIADRFFEDWNCLRTSPDILTDVLRYQYGSDIPAKVYANHTVHALSHNGEKPLVSREDYRHPCIFETIEYVPEENCFNLSVSYLLEGNTAPHRYW